MEVFRDLKKVYGYRSAVVHGSATAARKEEIVRQGGDKVPAHAVAVDLLRLALSVLLQHPRYRDPKAIDEDLLCGKLQAADANEKPAVGTDQCLPGA